jgi:hypothetical protein
MMATTIISSIRVKPFAFSFLRSFSIIPFPPPWGSKVGFYYHNRARERNSFSSFQDPGSFCTATVLAFVLAFPSKEYAAVDPRGNHSEFKRLAGFTPAGTASQ